VYDQPPRFEQNHYWDSAGTPLPAGFLGNLSMKRIMSLILLLIFAGFSLGMTSVSASQPETVVRVSPSLVMLNPGESTTIEIWVDDVIDLFGFAVEIHYDHNIISANSLTLGDFLEPGMTIRDEIDHENGIIWYDMTQWGQSTEPKSGSGVLFRFEITLLEATSRSELTIISALLTTRDGFDIPCRVEKGFVSTPGMGPAYTVYLPLIMY
jgi:hypothetical protein